RVMGCETRRWKARRGVPCEVFTDAGAENSPPLGGSAASARPENRRAAAASRRIFVIELSAARDARSRFDRCLRRQLQAREALLEPFELAVEQVPRGPILRDVVVRADRAEVLGD